MVLWASAFLFWTDQQIDDASLNEIAQDACGPELVTQSSEL